MNVFVNDGPCETQAVSVADLVQERGVNPARVAVVVNEAVLPSAAWSVTKLQDGDRLELLAFAGGG